MDSPPKLRQLYDEITGNLKIIGKIWQIDAIDELIRKIELPALYARATSFEQFLKDAAVQKT